MYQASDLLRWWISCQGSHRTGCRPLVVLPANETNRLDKSHQFARSDNRFKQTLNNVRHRKLSTTCTLLYPNTGIITKKLLKFSGLIQKLHSCFTGIERVWYKSIMQQAYFNRKIITICQVVWYDELKALIYFTRWTVGLRCCFEPVQIGGEFWTSHGDLRIGRIHWTVKNNGIFSNDFKLVFSN